MFTDRVASTTRKLTLPVKIQSNHGKTFNVTTMTLLVILALTNALK